LLEVFREHGRQLSLYTDWGSHYRDTSEAGGPVDPHRSTQVGQALSYSESRSHDGAACRRLQALAARDIGCH
jgi:hypothetical protein